MEVVVLDRKRLIARFGEQGLPWSWACELLVGEKGVVHEIVSHEGEEAETATSTILVVFPNNLVLGDLCEDDRAWQVLRILREGLGGGR